MRSLTSNFRRVEAVRHTRIAKLIDQNKNLAGFVVLFPIVFIEFFQIAFSQPTLSRRY